MCDVSQLKDTQKKQKRQTSKKKFLKIYINTILIYKPN